MEAQTKRLYELHFHNFAREFTEKYKTKTRFLFFYIKWKLYLKAGV